MPVRIEMLRNKLKTDYLDYRLYIGMRYTIPPFF